MSINRVILSGIVSRPASLSYGKSSEPYLLFGLSFYERRKVDGAWEDHKCFIDCLAFGRLATDAAPYLIKNRKVEIDGRLHQNKLSKSSSTGFQIIADDMTLGPVMGVREGEGDR